MTGIRVPDQVRLQHYREAQERAYFRCGFKRPGISLNLGALEIAPKKSDSFPRSAIELEPQQTRDPSHLTPHTWMWEVRAPERTNAKILPRFDLWGERNRSGSVRAFYLMLSFPIFVNISLWWTLQNLR